jgi:hypothetical protein
VILAPARVAMKRWVAGGIARSSRQSRYTICRAILVADPGRAVAGLCRNRARDARDDIGGEQPFERGEISSLGGVDERVEESLGWAALTCLRRSPARWRRARAASCRAFASLIASTLEICR